MTKLEIKFGGFEIAFDEIWACWPNLEELAVSESQVWESNYDLEICGISIEEGDSTLLKKGIKYLQAVHIVPSRPAITTMHSK